MNELLFSKFVFYSSLGLCYTVLAVYITQLVVRDRREWSRRKEAGYERDDPTGLWYVPEAQAGKSGTIREMKNGWCGAPHLLRSSSSAMGASQEGPATQTNSKDNH